MRMCEEVGGVGDLSFPRGRESSMFFYPGFRFSGNAKARNEKGDREVAFFICHFAN
jgi:hypothetical protein